MTSEAPRVRPGLPGLPDRMARLPVDARGYPVPWFVAWLDASGRASPRGQGTPDFRVVAPLAIRNALAFKVCWICGDRLGAHKAFVVGPMCALNRISSEPPSHLDCADFAARACPFLTRPKAERRTTNLPEDRKDAAGIGLQRNPGVTLVWVTKSFRVRRISGNEVAVEGNLFQLGDPEQLRWYREGRPATREEILESIGSGLPSLRELAKKGGHESVAELESMVREGMALVPTEAT